MALSRMLSLGEICSVRSSKLFLSPQTKCIRNFKRYNKEVKKHEFESLASPFQDVIVDPKTLKISNLWKPFGFTVLFSSVCYCGAAIWHYENMRAHALDMLKRPGAFGYSPPKAGRWRREINSWWKSLSQGEKVFFPIAFLNTLVFFAWRVPQFQPYMLKYFCSNPGSRAVCWPMILSTFSHYSTFHLLANMFVLHSFSTAAVASLGKEQFVALYLTGGVVSSFTSYVYKVLMKQPGFSLGASGAIMTILGYVCTQYPNTRLGIIFFPFLSFSAGSAIKAIVGLDATGVILGWRIFDHAAHLGGAALGIIYAHWGEEYVWHKKEPILHYWHKLRGSIK